MKQIRNGYFLSVILTAGSVLLNPIVSLSDEMAYKHEMLIQSNPELRIQDRNRSEMNEEKVMKRSEQEEIRDNMDTQYDEDSKKHRYTQYNYIVDHGYQALSQLANTDRRMLPVHHGFLTINLNFRFRMYGILI